MLQVRQDNKESRLFDPDPANVERRYTHFLDLYNGLKKDHASLLSGIAFPRKIMMGNFEPNLISNRCSAFESLLDLIANESRLRESPAAISFFQDIELSEARRLIDENKFDQALSVLETSFRLLNKVYTDRSRVVLSVLCRIVACASASSNALAGPVERWAQLALRRYEAVSDSDLLLIYAPLLHSCISIWETLGRDKSKLVEELNSLRKRGKMTTFCSITIEYFWKCTTLFGDIAVRLLGCS
ncbi:sorting nexin-20 isoform X2 [Hyposmocoma kahamanoa]|uniref:sorting nexin-20 isoform X2 n=1 Tax=Hyposmocoma kahamanoa TaxID=1477025 RepID=UPI000E6D86DE|nr:sorting nexin-20 isoform X2 [Hyposmocoma kahamanoa]